MTNSNIRSESQLLRIPFHSEATDDDREFLVYLPIGYEDDRDRRWPVILFLHGGGERGNGRDELDYAMRHGPLAEAWLYHRDLPFIIIAPQLPVFAMHEQVQLRSGVPKPERLPEGPLSRDLASRPGQPMARAVDLSPAEFGVTAAWGDDGAPGGWHLYGDDLIQILDTVLGAYRTDPDRVYLTGLSYGGYGTWFMAAAYPDRWAAAAPICGDGNSQQVAGISEKQLPMWIFHGGRDIRVKPRWSYDMANALESAGHKSVRLTIHEDLGHDSWTRVYSGWDIYAWFLGYRRS